MIYRFGDYELDAQLFELRRNGTPLPLECRAMGDYRREVTVFRPTA